MSGQRGRSAVRNTVELAAVVKEMEGTLAAYKTEHDKLTNEFGHSIDYYAHKQALASKGVTSAAVRTWISDNYICQHPAKYRPDEVAYAAQRRNTITANASPHETALQRLYEARKFTPQDEYLVEQKASQKQQLKTYKPNCRPNIDFVATYTILYNIRIHVTNRIIKDMRQLAHSYKNKRKPNPAALKKNNIPTKEN